jgi:hypothetical protein
MTNRLFTPFQPSIHGFHFNNQFTNLGGVAGGGRCGGMAFGGMDYFHAGLPVPFCRLSDFSPSTVPPDGTPLAEYISERLGDSFNSAGITFGIWTAAFDDAVAEWTREQATNLKSLLENSPVVLGLVGSDWAWELGDSHQVVAYGYEEDQGFLRIFIWDNNTPDGDEVTLSLSMDNLEPVLEETPRSDGTTSIGHWRGFFVESYNPKVPTYRDLVMTKALEPSTFTPRGDAPFTVRYTVTNQGVYPATASYSLAWTGPGGNALEYLLPPGSLVTLAPGQSYEYVVSLTFPQIAGPHRLTPAAVPNGGMGRIPFFEAATVIVDAKYAILLQPRCKVIRQLTRAGASGLEGAYEVRLQAGIQNLTPPVTTDWVVDGGALTASGNPVTLIVLVGSAPGPYRYDHPAAVTASAIDGNATMAFHILLPNDRILEPMFVSPLSKSDNEEPFSRVQSTATRLIVTARTFYSQLLVRLQGGGVFGPLANVQWSPTPIQDLGDGSAVFAMPPRNPSQSLGDGFGPSPFGFIDVTAQCTDAIGQPIIATARIMPYMISQWNKELPPLVRKFLPLWWIWDVQRENPIIHIGDQEVRATTNGLIVAGKKISLAPTGKRNVVKATTGLPLRRTIIQARWVVPDWTSGSL